MQRELLSITTPLEGVNTRWLTTLSGICVRRFGKQKPITITFVSSREIRRLNALYRGKDHATDILSFNFSDSDTSNSARWPQDRTNKKRVNAENIGGEILLCLPIMRKHAKQKQHSITQEFQILTIHGVLHIFGFDHEFNREAVIMEALEAKILDQLVKNLGKT